MDFLATLTRWPLDWVILIGLILVLSVDAVRSGPNRAATLALSFPLSALAVTELSKTAYVAPIVAQFSATPYAEAALFAIFFIAFFIFIRRIIGFWSDTRQGIVQAGIAGVATAAILVTVWIQVPALDSLWHFSGLIQSTFGESFRLLWLLGGYAALAYVRN